MAFESSFKHVGRAEKGSQGCDTESSACEGLEGIESKSLSEEW